MKGFRGSAFLAAVALFAGAAAGYCLAPRASGAAAAPAADKKAMRPIADAGESASVKSLRARVAELERLLAESRKAAASTNAISNAVAGARMQWGAGRGNPRDWLENMKKSDPERFVQMTNRFEQMRRHRAERQRRNLDFLASVDTSRMSAKAKRTHVALQEAMARREELVNQIREVHEDADAAEADRREVFRQMRENENELRRLRLEERDNLFESTANALGFEGDDAKEIVDTLKEVVSATDDGFGVHRGGLPPPPPSGGPGAGGR